jgi:hypothetical protein
MNGRELNNREPSLLAAETATAPLDKLFWLSDYNERCSMRKLPRVEIEVYIRSTPDDTLSELRRKINPLKRNSGYFGEKAFAGAAESTILAEMKRRHPGFSDSVYKRVPQLGLISMR